MEDQANALRMRCAGRSGRLPQRSPSRARTMLIASGKGGVGKTNLCLNLAVSLSQEGRRILLLDAAMGSAHLDVLCGICSPWNLSHVLSGAKRLAEVIVSGPAGIRLVPCGCDAADMAEALSSRWADLLDQLVDLDEEFDDVLIDTTSGLHRTARRLIQSADQVILVTTPEPTAIADTYGLIKTLRGPASKSTASPDWNDSALQLGGDEGRLPSLLLVANQVTSAGEARCVSSRISTACRRFLGVSIQPAGYVVADRHVAAAVRRCRLFVLEYPACPASRCVNRLAGRLTDPTRARSFHVPGRSAFAPRLLTRVAQVLGVPAWV